MSTEPSWKKRSRCRAGVDPDLFFVSDEDHRARNPVVTPIEQIAIDVCNLCPVTGNCLKYALDDPKLQGIWGGTTTWMRRALRRIRERASCPRCVRGRVAVLDHQTQACMNCGLSWHIE